MDPSDRGTDPTQITAMPRRASGEFLLEYRKGLLTVVREWAGATIAIMLLLGGFAAFVLGTANAQTTEALGVVRVDNQRIAREVDQIRGDLAHHASDANLVHRELKTDMHELQLDIRALYRRIDTGQRQSRLEPTEGGGGHGDMR